VTDTSDNSARPSKEHPLVDGERFTTAWIDIAKFPGGMMMSSHGGKFGPVPATTGCSITTSPLIADEWRARGSPVIEIQLTSAETPVVPQCQCGEHQWPGNWKRIEDSMHRMHYRHQPCDTLNGSVQRD
jgi:hypothetical protein